MGYIRIEYFGRTVSIKILSVGVHVGRIESVLNESKTVQKIREIGERFKGRTLILGVDDMDIFKGISLKLLGFEILLERNPKLRGKVVLVQIINPARSSGKDVQEARKEAILVSKRINSQYGAPNYDPLVLIEEPVPFYEKIAYYASSEYCIVNAVRDGMNLVLYEYIICRQGPNPSSQNPNPQNPNPNPDSTSTLIVSEFVGCSPSLSGAFRVNPWSVDDVADAMYRAIDLSISEKQMRHDKHYKYVSSHHVAYWAKSFLQDLERACKDHYNRRCWAIGFGLGFRVVALQLGFRKLSLDHVASIYKKSVKRAIFLDYDGTIVPESSINKAPSEDVIAILNNLCADLKNTVFVVSGRGRDSLDEWFSSCDELGIAAEHGYFVRWSKGREWETGAPPLNGEWKKVAEPVMKLYMETTDGSAIETKESAVVWHHQYADHDFGSCQAKELLNHLESVLANEPVMVKRGQHIVEVKPQGAVVFLQIGSCYLTV
ncbi:hypothetical protein LUZ60_003213 [Juncus effusus]|nr:hypothetical protein LUZ60_003213 [Juncus effusus]